MNEALKDRVQLLVARSRSYKAVFNKENRAVRVVLADLARYCRANKPTFSGEESHKAAFLEGRRDVMNRIMEQLNVSENDLRLYMENEK
jgi:hypothetical protein